MLDLQSHPGEYNPLRTESTSYTGPFPRYHVHEYLHLPLPTLSPPTLSPPPELESYFSQSEIFSQSETGMTATAIAETEMTATAIAGRGVSMTAPELEFREAGSPSTFFDPVIQRHPSHRYASDEYVEIQRTLFGRYKSEKHKSQSYEESKPKDTDPQEEQHRASLKSFLEKYLLTCLTRGVDPDFNHAKDQYENLCEFLGEEV